MSKANKCDRCGGFYERASDGAFVQVTGHYDRTPSRYDLCPKYHEEFRDWMQMGRDDKNEDH